MANSRLSSRVPDLHASPIREILSIIDVPGMVSFAGGLPAAETFPDMPVETVPRAYLQYGPTEGDATLRAYIAEDLGTIGLRCSPEQVLILSGSQQGIDLVAKLFVDSGTPVAVESPTYLAALQVFRFFGAQFMPFRADAPDKSWATNAPALAYTIPTFQNPTGRCYSADERDAVARACDRHAVPLFEDDPYRDLVYDACERSPICGRLERASWIYQGSFSKTLAPGLRLGFLVSSPDLSVYLSRLKQAADLHSNRLSQWLVLRQLRSPGRTERLESVVSLYRRRRDYFAEALLRHLAPVATWDVPPGGLFYWLRLNNRTRDTRALLLEAISHRVAFMPGEPFFPENTGSCGTLRLNFSHAAEADIERGLATLARLLR